MRLKIILIMNIEKLIDGWKFPVEFRAENKL